MNTDNAISQEQKKIISTVGMLVFLGTEAMMFTTLITAYIVLRFGSSMWFPATTPHLPLLLTSINTVILLSSSAFIHLAQKGIASGNAKKFIFHLLWTISLGSLFLGIQAFEWTRLIHEGLCLKTGAFGSVFFTLTGFHGLHVLIGILLMIFLLIQTFRNVYTVSDHNPVHVVSMYWHFVDAVWIVVFTSLYLF